MRFAWLLTVLLLAPPARAEEFRDHGYGGPTARAAVGPLGLRGFGAGFRIHGAPVLALELAYDRLEERQVKDDALGLYALAYPRPGGRTQPYVLGGLGYAWQTSSRHAAAWLGGGFEWFVAREIAIDCDIRAFVRAAASDETVPFARTVAGASAGLVFTFGGQLYVFGK